MPKLLLFLFLILTQIVSGQNLVPDPGFEIHDDTCTTNWPGLTHWYNPNTATPDLWNMLDGCGDNIPALWADGVELPTPMEGNCYAGLFTSTNVQANSHTREYFYTQLTNPLESGTIYHIQFSVYRMLYYGHAIDRLGIAFTDYAPFFDTFEVIPLNPQIETYGEVIQLDSSFWQTFEFYYTAQGGEEYLTIGNFRYPDEMLIEVNQSSQNMNRGYYFFDNIKVEADIASGISKTGEEFQAYIANGELIIDASSMQHFQLYDLGGRLVAQGVTSVGQTSKPLHALSKGVYVLHIHTNTGAYSKKLWKE